MSKGDFDFDQVVAGLVDEENKRKNSISHDGWGLEETSETSRNAAPKRRKVTWIVPTLGAGLVMGGAAVLILGGFMRPRAVADEPVAITQQSDTFATVSGGAPRGAHDPVVESGRTLPAQAEVAAEQLPLATSARRVTERQRPVPAGPKAAKEDESVDTEALLALAGQEKAESKAAPAPAAAVPITPAAAVEKPDVKAEEKLPDSLSRGVVHKGFQSVRSKVMACKAKAPEGTTVFEVTALIRPDGSIEDASIDGAVGESPAGACVAAAVKSAEFPRFSGTEPQKVTYPYPLQ